MDVAPYIFRLLLCPIMNVHVVRIGILGAVSKAISVDTGEHRLLSVQAKVDHSVGEKVPSHFEPSRLWFQLEQAISAPGWAFCVDSHLEPTG